MEGKTSHLDARQTPRNYSSEFKASEPPEKGPAPQSDRNSWSAGAVAQGAFKVGAKALTGHSSFQSWAALHLILPNYNCDQGAIGRSPLGSAPLADQLGPSKPPDLPKTDLPCVWGPISGFLIPDPYRALLESVYQCRSGPHPGSLLPDTLREGSQYWPLMSFPFPGAGIR